MYSDLLCIPIWNSETNGKFFKRIKDYTDEVKCTACLDVAEQLTKRGDNANIVSAEVILVYATQHYFNNVTKEQKATIYYTLGKLYEYNLEEFIKAYTAYEKYTLNTENDGTHALLTKAIILRDDFGYSDALEREYRHSLGEADLGLRNDRLYEALASFIINTHYGNTEQADKMKARLKGIVKGDKYFFLDLVFRKDIIPDSLTVPNKVIKYINSL